MSKAIGFCALKRTLSCTRARLREYILPTQVLGSRQLPLQPRVSKLIPRSSFRRRWNNFRVLSSSGKPSWSFTRYSISRGKNPFAAMTRHSSSKSHTFRHFNHSAKRSSSGSRLVNLTSCGLTCNNIFPSFGTKEMDWTLIFQRTSPIISALGHFVNYWPIILGRKRRSPTKKAAIEATSTAPAETSLAIFARSWISGLIILMVSSIAVFTSSRIRTKEMINVRCSHSEVVILKTMPRITARAPREIWILKFLPLVNAVFNPSIAYLKLLARE